MPISYKADPLKIALDASKLAKAAGEVIAKAHQQRIPAGQKGDGSGAQEAPIPNDKNGIRGYDTGMFARSIRAHTSTRGKTKGLTVVSPVGMDAKRWTWLGREKKRGITYLHPGAAGTPLSDEVDKALQEAIDEMIK